LGVNLGGPINRRGLRILLTCNEPKYADLPPGQIVPDLADQGIYIGSERSFYRVLHANSQLHRHCGKAIEICRRRARVYELARIANPKRWSRSIRCWKQPDLVCINPPADDFSAQTDKLVLAA
jgi:hypothetical protein